MESLKSVRVVHYFDTRTRQILCGLRGFEHPSTKHSRGVTCQACVKLLPARSAEGGFVDVAASDSAAQ
jgi:hypothetical protein